MVRRHAVTEQTLSRWKRKYGGMQVAEAKRLKSLDEEDRLLKALVADHALNLRVVKDVLRKGGDVRTATDGRLARDAIRRTLGAPSVPVHVLCVVVAWFQQRKEDSALGERLRTLAILRPRRGYRTLYHLLHREGPGVNRKRVQRAYQEAGL